MHTVKTIWWILGLYFFATEIYHSGLWYGLLNWINPLQPPT